MSISEFAILDFILITLLYTFFGLHNHLQDDDFSYGYHFGLYTANIGFVYRSKVGNHIRGRPEGSLFNCYYTNVCDANYSDDIALLANASAQAETQLHNLKRAAAGIGLYVNAHKTEYLCFNQTGNIFTLNGNSLELVNKFTYLGSSVSSTDSDIDTRLTKTFYRKAISHMEIRPDR